MGKFKPRPAPPPQVFGIEDVYGEPIEIPIPVIAARWGIDAQNLADELSRAASRVGHAPSEEQANLIAEAIAAQQSPLEEAAAAHGLDPQELASEVMYAEQNAGRAATPANVEAIAAALERVNAGMPAIADAPAAAAAAPAPRRARAPPPCPAGQERNPQTGRCRQACPRGRSEKTGRCLLMGKFKPRPAPPPQAYGIEDVYAPAPPVTPAAKARARRALEQLATAASKQREAGAGLRARSRSRSRY